MCTTRKKASLLVKYKWYHAYFLKNRGSWAEFVIDIGGPLEGGFESFTSFRLLLMLSCEIPDNEYSNCQLKKIEHVAQENIPSQI